MFFDHRFKTYSSYEIWSMRAWGNKIFSVNLGTTFILRILQFVLIGLVGRVTYTRLPECHIFKILERNIYIKAYFICENISTLITLQDIANHKRFILTTNIKRSRLTIKLTLLKCNQKQVCTRSISKLCTIVPHKFGFRQGTRYEWAGEYVCSSHGWWRAL